MFSEENFFDMEIFVKNCSKKIIRIECKKNVKIYNLKKFKEKNVKKFNQKHKIHQEKLIF